MSHTVCVIDIIRMSYGQSGKSDSISCGFKTKYRTLQMLYKAGEYKLIEALDSQIIHSIRGCPEIAPKVIISIITRIFVSKLN